MGLVLGNAYLARARTPLTRTLCRIRRRRLADSAPPKGRGASGRVQDQGGGTQRGQNGILLPRVRGPIYVSTKRTHRFLRIFLMQLPLHTVFAMEMCGEIRWVRFGKRTHREGVNEGVSSKSGSFWDGIRGSRCDGATSGKDACATGAQGFHANTEAARPRRSPERDSG
jgi:hypothetical protein